MRPSSCSGSCYHEGDKKRAVAALKVASKSQRLRKQAQRWLERIQEDGKPALHKMRLKIAGVRR